MPDWLLSRPLIIALAFIGGAISVLVTWCKSRGVLTEQQIAWLNKASYVFMGVSIALFVAAGFFSG